MISIYDIWWCITVSYSQETIEGMFITIKISPAIKTLFIVCRGSALLLVFTVQTGPPRCRGISEELLAPIIDPFCATYPDAIKNQHALSMP